MSDELRTSNRETRRLALQATAEIWRGLDVLDAELKLGRFSDARKTVGMIRQMVKVADCAWVAALREQSRTPTFDNGRLEP